jgi:hypothetical protein
MLNKFDIPAKDYYFYQSKDAVPLLFYRLFVLLTIFQYFAIIK